MRRPASLPLALLALLGLLLPGACGDPGGEGAGSATASGRAASGGAEAADGAGGGRAELEGQEAAGSDSASEPGGEVRIRVAGIPVTVEVADESSERERGLMGRDSLPDDHGMLFVYGQEATRSFWMRNTRIPLSIAFLDRRGHVVDIQQMDPESDSLYTSRQPAMYALEMDRGWFREHGVAVGDRVEF